MWKYAWEYFKDMLMVPVIIFSIIAVVLWLAFSFCDEMDKKRIQSVQEMIKMHLIEENVESKVQEVEMGAGVIQVFTYEGHIYPLAKFSNGAYVPCTRILYNVQKNNRGDYSFDIKYYIMKEQGNDQGKEN